ncbi:MAG: SpoIIE family protein phosphatase [Chloroflexota bacterium]
MEVQIAVAKVRKYATSNSGDTVEVVERPQGGVSVVMADGQSSGRGAKMVSNLVVRKVIALLAEGVRDGAAARAASDSLFTERNGKVSSTLNILSVDQQTQTVVITRNNPAPALLAYGDQIKVLDEPSQPVGIYRGTRPVITEAPLEAGLTAVIFTDGLVHAGERSGSRLEVATCLEALLEDCISSPQQIADSLLEQALKLDEGRPVDDVSVVVVGVLPATGDEVRRMSVRLPLHS